jgi:hypothetical protein
MMCILTHLLALELKCSLLLVAGVNLPKNTSGENARNLPRRTTTGVAQDTMTMIIFDFCNGDKSTLFTFLMIQLELTELAPFFSAALRADITLDTHPTDDKMLSWSSSPSVNAPGGRTGGSEV